MDWLLERQERIETALAKRHLAEGTLVLYDVTSTYFEGRHCPLARLGHSRDGRFDRPQIVFGLLTDAEGCPVAVEVFDGNTGDPKTVLAQVKKLRERFSLERVVLVGDRGMITSARIRKTWCRRPASSGSRRFAGRPSASWSTPERSTCRSSTSVTWPRSSPDYPGERLIVCRNPLLAAERKRKREELLEATEKELEKVAVATRRAKNSLRGKAPIGLRVGRVLGRFKMAKHFKLEITEERFSYQRNQDTIAQEAALDGIYVIRTSVALTALSPEEVVLSYKRLAHVERAFRCLKTVDIKLRPIHHHGSLLVLELPAVLHEIARRQRGLHRGQLRLHLRHKPAEVAPADVRLHHHAAHAVLAAHLGRCLAGHDPRHLPQRHPLTTRRRDQQVLQVGQPSS